MLRHRLSPKTGAAVVLADINKALVHSETDKLLAAGYKVTAVVCDVADETQVAAMIQRTVATYGRLDMAFNNAGIAGHSGSLTDETTESF
ncbi:SDR family oxidoreductase, partial [Pseudomonas neuropathica]|uniref:SDR family oxidoreductase n=1 Tax=Pseudomonas neuropathica TaxID=2730425 RepID=UPI0034D5C859